ncbi:hypothetical protein [Pedobacter rhizosphaerae]|uniref:dTDP-4-amino-4,6-dideoxygalactose transaminase n=1 Tax=Pedobacter rhizosphaerae TaxID=390241 RepID=A0A1H9M6E5_9SPHI|nr:hypothetical protein [Pedobacter rhizosphaerae]SER18693.1 hypothetical protein SAMN04488023_105103 [Pedobacter rhizosphaerae]
METQTLPAKTIGGYIELQLNPGRIFHPELLPLNTGRNALEYILRVRQYNTIYLPYYTCDVLLEPLHKLNITYHFYKVDEDLDPIIDFEITEKSCLLYTNYYGLKTETVRRLAKTTKNLIVDNAQAFFTKPIQHTDTFYSCRKFFGVPDGAYLYISKNLGISLKQDRSVERCSHLLKSIDLNIEEGYTDYIENNKDLCNREIMKMSALSTRILAGINYEQCALIRQRNYDFLHEHLSSKNLLQLNRAPEEVPMVYPLLLDIAGVKQQLIAKKIFVATYWPNVFDWVETDSFEYFLTNNLIALPIDHRYNADDMMTMVKALNSLL